MERIEAIVVADQGVGLPVQHKFPPGNPVPEPADETPEIRAPGNIVLKLIEPENNIPHHPITIRHLERQNCPAVVGDAGLHASLVGQGKHRDLAPISQGPEHIGFNRSIAHSQTCLLQLLNTGLYILCSHFSHRSHCADQARARLNTTPSALTRFLTRSNRLS